MCVYTSSTALYICVCYYLIHMTLFRLSSDGIIVFVVNLIHMCVYTSSTALYICVYYYLVHMTLFRLSSDGILVVVINLIHMFLLLPSRRPCRTSEGTKGPFGSVVLLILTLYICVCIDRYINK